MKKINGLDIKLNSNYFGFNNSVDYFTNFEISGIFYIIFIFIFQINLL